MSGKPAARIGDNHTCPEVTVIVPHVGGPIVEGSEDVFINGIPAARVGDSATCVGPTDQIATGSATVFINGKPAARLGDMTEHGGVIIGGSNNVFIGDSPGGGGGGAGGAASETTSLLNVIKEYLGSVLSGEQLEKSLAQFDKYLDKDMDLETTRQMIDEFAVFGGVGKLGKAVKSVNKPSVSDPKLENLVNDLYKGANTKKPIGTGSTADAIRQEALTGKSVGGKFHTQKGQQYSNALKKWLSKNPDAPAADKQAAQSILDDLTDALGGGK